MITYKGRYSQLRKYIHVFLILLMAGCSGGDDEIIGTGGKPDPTPQTITAAAHKGPFVIGSNVTINLLTDTGQATDDTIITSTRDDLGNFSFNLDKPRLVQIKIDGYHFNEISGNVSNGPITLSAIHDTRDSNFVVVNILTHLVNNRISHLVENGGLPGDAMVQAQEELIRGFRDVLIVDQLPEFGSLGIYNLEGTDAVGNAYLLALSATLYNYASIMVGGDSGMLSGKLSEVINSLASDLASDGDFDAVDIIAGLAAATQSLNPDEIEANLRRRSRDVINEELEVPDINLFIDTDRDGLVNSVDDDDDNDGIADSVDNNPYVYNTIPVAVVGANLTVANKGALITLDGTASHDADGHALTYQWAQTSGTPVTLINPTVSNPVFVAPQTSGDITMSLTVNDGFISSAPNSVTITVINQAPVAVAGTEQLNLPKRSAVTLDGRNSSDPDGDSISFLWQQVSGISVTLDDAHSSMPTFTTPAAPSNLTFALTVIDNEQLASQQSTVHISVINNMPFAAAGDDQSVSYDYENIMTITLDGSQSYDIDQDTLQYSWTYVGANPNLVLVNPLTAQPYFELPESYGETLQFLLEVTDESGLSATDMVVVNTTSMRPVANAGSDQIGVSQNATVVLSGVDSYDLDSTEISYHWTQIAGPPVSLVNSDSVHPSFVFPQGVADRTVEFQLIVNDGEQDSRPDTVIVSVVNYAGNTVEFTSIPFGQSVNLVPPTFVSFGNLNFPMDIKIANDRAYIADRTGLRIIDVSDRTAPVLLNSFVTLSDAIILEVIGDLVHVLGQDNTGINMNYEMINVADIGALTRVGSWHLYDPPYRLAGTPGLGMIVENNAVFLVDYYHGLHVLDISMPTSPSLESSFYYPNYRPWIYSSGMISDDVYLGTSEGLQVIHVTDPSNPGPMADTNVVGRISDIIFQNENLFTAQSRPNTQSYNGGLEVFSRTTPTTFRKLSSLDTLGTAKDIAIDNDILFLGDYWSQFAGHPSGYYTIDVSDLHVPSMMAGITTNDFRYLKKVAYNNGTIYVLDQVNGLYILNDFSLVMTPNFTPDDVLAGNTINYTIQWQDYGSPVEFECRVSAGNCAVSNINSITRTATLSWTLPSVGGNNYKMSVAVGNYHYFVGANDTHFVP